MIPLMGVIFSLFLSAESRIHKTPGSNTLSRTHDGILKMYGAFFNQGKCFTVILISHSHISKCTGFGQVSCFLRKQIPGLKGLKVSNLSVVCLICAMTKWVQLSILQSLFNIPCSPSNQFTPSQSKLKSFIGSKKVSGSSNRLSASCSFSYRI